MNRLTREERSAREARWRLGDRALCMGCLVSIGPGDVPAPPRIYQCLNVIRPHKVFDRALTQDALLRLHDEDLAKLCSETGNVCLHCATVAQRRAQPVECWSCRQHRRARTKLLARPA